MARVLWGGWYTPSPISNSSRFLEHYLCRTPWGCEILHLLLFPLENPLPPRWPTHPNIQSGWERCRGRILYCVRRVGGQPSRARPQPAGGQGWAGRHGPLPGFLWSLGSRPHSADSASNLSSCRTSLIASMVLITLQERMETINKTQMG